MPILKPRSGEAEKDFIARFMADPKMVSEYPEEKQRLAIAYSTWKESFERINDVEMWRAGFSNDGRNYGVDRVARIVENTRRAMADGWKPKVRIGSTHRTDDVQGLIQNIRQIGDSLVADFEMTTEAYQKLKSKQINDDRSIELMSGFYLQNGEKLNDVLSGIVVGMAKPAEHYLQSMFGTLDMKAESFERLATTGQSGDSGGEMEKVLELLQKIIGAMEKFERNDDKAELKSVMGIAGSEVAKLKEEFEHSKIEHEKITKENGELKKKVEEFERKDKEVFEAARKAFIEGLITAGKVLPAQKENAELIYNSMSEKFGRLEAEKKLNDIYNIKTGVHTESGVQVVKEDKEDFGRIDPTVHPEIKGGE